jgi:hypothetical protein
LRASYKTPNRRPSQAVEKDLTDSTGQTPRHLMIATSPRTSCHITHGLKSKLNQEAANRETLPRLPVTISWMRIVVSQHAFVQDLKEILLFRISKVWLC